MKDNVIGELISSIKEAPEETQNAYSAVVSKVDSEGVVWVHLAGSDKETPTASTSAEIKSGDIVTVEWRNNKLYIAGNYSNPSAGTERVIRVEAVAKGAEDTANNAESVAQSAQASAQQAQQIAADTEQHFWFTETGNDTGAHITEVTQDEWNDSNSPNYHRGGNLLARSNGIAVRDGMNELSQFGANGTQIGQNGQTRILQDYHSLQMKDKEGNTYFHVSDLRDSDGNAEITQTYYGDGEDDSFNLVLNATDTTYTVTVSDSSGGTVSKYRSYFKFSSPPTNGATITAVYTTNDYKAKAYSVGLRGSGDVGVMSVAEGYNVVASGYASHAEGNNTKASGNNSHAEGYNTAANDNQAHAEGYYTIASGRSSHSQNYRTIAAKQGQTALGTYNIEDTSNTTTHPNGDGTFGKYAVIVGNGTTDSSRSNALTVDWNGNVRIGGNSHAIGDRPQVGEPTGEVTSLNTATWKVVGRFTVPKGVSIVNVAVSFGANATGKRQAFISTNNTNDSSGLLANVARDYRNAVSGSETSCHFCYSTKQTADTTYYIKAYQNSGSQLTISTRVYTTVIK